MVKRKEIRKIFAEELEKHENIKQNRMDDNLYKVLGVLGIIVVLSGIFVLAIGVASSTVPVDTNLTTTQQNVFINARYDATFSGILLGAGAIIAGLLLTFSSYSTLNERRIERILMNVDPDYEKEIKGYN